MIYSALYSTIFRVRNLVRVLAKVYTWAYGLQFVILYGLATAADAPLGQLTDPGLRFVGGLAVMFFAPKVFDIALRLIVKAAAGGRR